jgi:ABC-2 type transport system ATP-binding protein
MIDVQGLTHFYGERRAIEGLSFTIARNECVGFLGLNGAGKSTTLKILAGLIVPASGTVAIDGADLVSSAAAFRSRIGYLPEDPPLYKDMTVREFVSHCGELKGMSAVAVRSRLDDVLATTQLTHVGDRVISELSHGYRKRCGIAQAIIHQPTLVILDEPISGLDPKQIVEMRNVVRTLARTCTVLISSHILGEIAETCDRILVLNGGRIVAHGTPGDFAKRLRGTGTRLSFTLRGDVDVIKRCAGSVPSVLTIEATADDEGLVRAHVSFSHDDREGLVAAFVAAGVGIRGLSEDQTQLENVFLEITKEAMA